MPLITVDCKPYVVHLPVSLFRRTFCGFELSVDAMAKNHTQQRNERLWDKRKCRKIETRRRSPLTHQLKECSDQTAPSLQPQWRIEGGDGCCCKLRHDAHPLTNGPDFLRLRHAAYCGCLVLPSSSQQVRHHQQGGRERQEGVYHRAARHPQRRRTKQPKMGGRGWARAELEPFWITSREAGFGAEGRGLSNLLCPPPAASCPRHPRN